MVGGQDEVVGGRDKVVDQDMGGQVVHLTPWPDQSKKISRKDVCCSKLTDSTVCPTKYAPVRERYRVFH